jgi:4-hydroxymandelate oxidase
MNWSYSDIYDRGMERIREAGAEKCIDLGAETQSQNRINREYMEQLLFEMRLMGSQWADTSYTLFGKQLPAPIISSALTHGRLPGSISQYSTPYLLEIASGIARAGTIMTVGMSSPPFLQQIIDQGVDFIKIVKPYRSSRDESDYIIYTLKDAEARGALAVGIDVDVFYGEKAWDENPLLLPFGVQSMQHLERFRRATELPFIVKGVLSVHDALKSKEIGADAIVVSNHGGEAIDYTIPVLKVLPEIREAVPEMLILIDSGFRRGTDILKALALGADCVCVLTILLIAYAAYGAQGVCRMMQILSEELKRNMSITGCKDVESIDRTIIRT